MPQETCKNYKDFSSFIDGRMDGQSIRDIARHLENCDECREEVTRLLALRRTLNELTSPSLPPNPEFWSGAYRKARLEALHADAAAKNSGYLFMRRAAASLVAVACVLCAALAAPLISSNYREQPLTTFTYYNPTPSAVDIGPLLRAHTAYSAMQPLSDNSRMSMILSDEASENVNLPADYQANAAPQ